MFQKNSRALRDAKNMGAETQAELMWVDLAWNIFLSVLVRGEQDG